MAINVRRRLSVEDLLHSTLELNPRNPRKPVARESKRTAQNIKSFGFTNPVRIEPSYLVLTGHARVQALKKLGVIIDRPVTRRKS